MKFPETFCAAVPLFILCEFGKYDHYMSDFFSVKNHNALPAFGLFFSERIEVLSSVILAFIYCVLSVSGVPR